MSDGLARMNGGFNSCHLEPSRGPAHSAVVPVKYMDPSRGERAQDDKRHLRESAEKKLPWSSA